MAFKGIDHVVVRVQDLEAAIETYRQMLDLEPRRATSEALQAEQAFFEFPNGTFLELIMPTDEGSPLASALEKRGEGIHTVAFAVDDQAQTAKTLEDTGLRVLNGTFVHPASAHGVLVQLSESK